MASQTDLDKGGTSRQLSKRYLGPSVGWIDTPAPAAAVLPITAAGTYTIELSTTLVTINVNGAVILNLPRARTPTQGPQAVPGPFAQNPITIVDIGGFAGANPITINSASGENIMGLASIQLSVNYGGYTLKPVNAMSGWESISP